MGRKKYKKWREEEEEEESVEIEDGCCCVCNNNTNTSDIWYLNLKCVSYFAFGLAALLSVFLYVKPFLPPPSDFQANNDIQISASVRAYFRLPKPVSQLLPSIPLLEYDLRQDIQLPDIKVAVLSMNQVPDEPNATQVEFGLLSRRIKSPIHPMSLSILKLSLVELFIQQSNLTLTTSIFGRPYDFQILKFPEEITINPDTYTSSISPVPGSFFNFTINKNMSNILNGFAQFKHQLKTGLHLKHDETVNIHITSHMGSTRNPPVKVQAWIVSDRGLIVPQRLKQLAQSITDSPKKNLGLNNSTFGKVKYVSLSSYLKGAIHPHQPSPSPAPSPEPSEYSILSVTPVSSVSPSQFPAPCPDSLRLPCPSMEASSPGSPAATPRKLGR